MEITYFAQRPDPTVHRVQARSFEWSRGNTERVILIYYGKLHQIFKWLTTLSDRRKGKLGSIRAQLLGAEWTQHFEAV